MPFSLISLPRPLRLLAWGATAMLALGGCATSPSTSQASLDSLDSSRTYFLNQLHFHTPSEHLVAHQRFPVEAHFVHRSEDGHLLVLGVLFDVGATNAFIERILSDAPRDIGHIDLDRSIDLNEIFPSSKHVYAYKGSLTTPPYQEDVQWLVLSEHPSVSPEQVVRLLVLEGGNARPVQPRNQRTVESATVGE